MHRGAALGSGASGASRRAGACWLPTQPSPQMDALSWGGCLVLQDTTVLLPALPSPPHPIFSFPGGTSRPSPCLITKHIFLNFWFCPLDGDAWRCRAELRAWIDGASKQILSRWLWSDIWSLCCFAMDSWPPVEGIAHGQSTFKFMAASV